MYTFFEQQIHSVVLVTCGPAVPRPQVELLQKQVSHYPFQLAKPVCKWLGGIGECLDETSLRGQWTDRELVILTRGTVGYSQR